MNKNQKQPGPYSGPSVSNGPTPEPDMIETDPVRALAESLFVAIHSRGTPASAAVTAKVAIDAARAFDAAWEAQ